MSWLDDIGGAIGGAIGGVWDAGKQAIGGIFGGGNRRGGGSNILGSLISTAITGFALKKITDSINNSRPAPTTTPPPPDTGVNIQIDPNPQAKVPVLYGTSYVNGILTDAIMSADNKTMYYVLTLCEKTGTKISDNATSEIEFNEIYYNDQRIVFNTDGITAQYTLDRNSNVDYGIQGLVQVYCFNGSSNQPVVPTGYNNVLLVPAYQIIPGWDSNKVMNDLAFAIVKITYNRDRGTTGVPNMTFKLENSMRLPGDCMYDYMTNTRYGAGIPSEDIFVE